MHCRENNQGEWIKYCCGSCKGHVIKDEGQIVLAKALNKISGLLEAFNVD